MSETKKCGSDYMLDILNLLVRKGALENKRITDARIRSEKQKKNEKAYHNTELLLRHYRDIVWLMECFPETIAEELEQPFESVDDVIERLDLELAKDNRRVEHRLESIKKTRLVLDRVNDALTVLKKKPDDGERLYNLIYLTYITPENLNHNEILFRLNLSSRHYYRLRDQAIAILSIRLWSAPNKDTEFWLEMLAAIEE